MQTDKRQRVAFYLFYSGLVLLVAALPLSKFMMSISQFMLAAGWLLDGGIAAKFRKFTASRIALLLTSVFLLHLIGLAYTSDFIYAGKDLRIKLPLLILPLMLSTAPKLSKSQFEGILFALVGGVTVSTFISWFIYLGIINRPVNDIRDISIFISHIRLALLCCLSVFSIVWLIWQHRNDGSARYHYLLFPLVPWLVYFLFLLESLTGLSILVVTALILANGMVFKKSDVKARLLVVAISIAIPLSVFQYVKSVNEIFLVRQDIDTSQLEQKTPSGNNYQHDPERQDYENGYPLWLYVCESEMEKEWNSRSQMPYAGRDERQQEIKYTLIRFLTSKGLRKDSAGVATLTPSEIHSVEKGIANAGYQEKGNIKIRIHQVLWELHQYRKTGDPSGHSVAQRWEFWNAAVEIIKINPVFGVGTGDVPRAFKEQYRIMHSKLSAEWRLRSHNQYLSIAVAFGLFGLTWFLIALCYPLVRQARKNDFLYVSFSIISILSMITEDTLETQAGVTFFALFTSLFLFVNPNNSAIGVK